MEMCLQTTMKCTLIKLNTLYTRNAPQTMYTRQAVCLSVCLTVEALKCELQVSISYGISGSNIKSTDTSFRSRIYRSLTGHRNLSLMREITAKARLSKTNMYN